MLLVILLYPASSFCVTAEAIQDTVDFYAKRLQDAVEGFGTNDKQLIRIIVSRSEVI